MAKRTPNYVITALLTIGAACLSSFISQRQPQVSFVPRLDALPMRIGDWQGRDTKLDPGIREALAGDGILCRDYTDSRGRQISLLIVYRKYGRRGFTHRPEMCYPAAGWEVISKTYAHLPYAGHSIQVRQMEASKDGNRALVTFWFASGDRTEASYVKQQARMTLDRIQPHKYGWAFIRMDVYELQGHEEALGLTRAFIADIQKPLARILTGSE